VNDVPLAMQLVELLASLLLLLSFAMLAQRRIVSLVNLFALQGAVLAASTVAVAASAGLHHLYYSAALTVALKVLLLPYFLRRLIVRLGLQWDTETLVAIPLQMLAGLGLVIFAFGLAQPISQFGHQITRETLGIAIAMVLLSLLMMIGRRKAVSQVVGFLALENGLVFAATTATQGMPMVVEFGIALDVLVGAVILGVFFFQIREQFDSLELRHLETLREE
jgi:hydrogenase-4 component E